MSILGIGIFSIVIMYVVLRFYFAALRDAAVAVRDMGIVAGH